MPSVEGRGVARRAWDGYIAAVRKVSDPVVTPLAKRYGASVVTDLAGFWLLWHAHGGFEGLQKLGMPRTTIFRKIKRFRQVFGEHPDEFGLPGVHIDYEVYWAAAEESAERRRRKVAEARSSKT